MKISVITATYNSGATLRHTLESVLLQTYRDIEYIIVDGASKDNTRDIVREYEPQFNGRMRWISEPDNGLYDAMNKGILMATGDVIGILNSDDFFSSNYVLERIAKDIDGFDSVYGDVHYVNPNNLKKCVRVYSSGFFRPGLMKFGFMPAHPSFYCRRDIYGKLGVFNTQLKVAADFELLLRLIFVKRISTRYIPMDFVTMRTGGASNNGFKSHKQIFQDHMAAYKLNQVNSNIFFEGCRYIFRIFEMLYRKLVEIKKK